MNHCIVPEKEITHLFEQKTLFNLRFDAVHNLIYVLMQCMGSVSFF